MKSNNIQLSRAGLKHIHSIACRDWKSRLEKWAERDILEDYITLSPQEVKQMFAAATEDQKPVLEKYLKLPEEAKKITDRINSLEDVEEIIGREITLPYPVNTRNKQMRSLNASVIIFALAEAYNEGTVLDWRNTDQHKWFPYKSIASGDWVVRYDVWYANRSCPAGLYFASEEVCKDAVEKFPEVFEDYWME